MSMKPSIPCLGMYNDADAGRTIQKALSANESLVEDTHLVDAHEGECGELYIPNPCGALFVSCCGICGST
jgi:hypothetical protein